jgi:hypothetical protein
MHRRTFSAIVALACMLAGPLHASDFSGVAGKWQGPWYRGMTSGQMTLEVTAEGSGRVAFTNLESFGEAPAGLHKTQASGKTIEFSANGASGSEFTAKCTLIDGGKLLRGTARYEGFPVKFDLQRQ